LHPRLAGWEVGVLLFAAAMVPGEIPGRWARARHETAAASFFPARAPEATSMRQGRRVQGFGKTNFEEAEQRQLADELTEWARREAAVERSREQALLRGVLRGVMLTVDLLQGRFDVRRAVSFQVAAMLAYHGGKPR
jgi:hypothetical protein